MISVLQKNRYSYTPKLPESLSGSIEEIDIDFGPPTEAISDKEELRAIFKNTYGKPLVTFLRGKKTSSASIDFKRELKAGVILSGGQAPGGHNVIAGLFDGLKKGNPNSTLYGFLGGPSGLIDNKTIILTKEIIDQFRNTGGFDIIDQGGRKLRAALNLRLHWKP